MPSGRDEFVTASADLARERMLGRFQRPQTSGAAGRRPRRRLLVGVATLASTTAVLGLLGSFALPYVSAQREQALALESSQQEIAALQSKLDQWMVAAAEREAQIEAEISHREREITTLGRELESAEVERRASAQMAQRLAILKAGRDELALSLAAAQRALFETKAAYANDLARTQSDARSQRAMEHRLVSSRRELEQSELRNQSLEQQVRSLERALAEQQDELASTDQTSGQVSASSEDVQALRDAAQLAARKLHALRGSLPGDLMTRSALDALRRNATAELFEEQSRLASSIGGNGLYLVRESDTLSQISARLLGTPDRWQELYEVNRHLLGSADTIHPGTPLVLPPTPSAAPASLAQGRPELLL